MISGEGRAQPPPRGKVGNLDGWDGVRCEQEQESWERPPFIKPCTLYTPLGLPPSGHARGLGQQSLDFRLARGHERIRAA